jgi:hypothetical protein
MMTEAQAGIVSWAHHHTAGSSAPVSQGFAGTQFSFSGRELNYSFFGIG